MLCTVVALCASSAPVELHILPHTHADVGWLQTVNSLARLNVSIILDGVVEELWARPLPLPARRQLVRHVINVLAPQNSGSSTAQDFIIAQKVW